MYTCHKFNNIEEVKIGNFIIESDSVIVSDPSYDMGTWCQGVILNIKPGKYNAFILKQDCGEWGNRVSALYVLHEKYVFDTSKIDMWNECPFEVGVDSGQAGIFDISFYLNDDLIQKSDYSSNPQYDGSQNYSWEDNEKEDNFYYACCSHTLSLLQAGVLAKGAVARSGFGDGDYRAFTKSEDDGKVFAIKIIFIELEEKE
jgi:hypothetical protein